MRESKSISLFGTLQEAESNVCGRYDLGAPSNIDGGLRGLSLPFF